MTTPQPAETKKLEPQKIIRMPKVREVTGLGTTAIYDRIKEGSFPKQINLGGRAIGFIESQIQNWISERIADSLVKSEIVKGDNHE